MQYRRFGRLVRAVRRELGLRQLDVAKRAGVSQATVSRVESGDFESLACATVDRIGEALNIRVDLLGSWQGARGDRLVDAAHAALVNATAAALVGAGWEVRVEYSFNHYGDRGRVDVLGWKGACRALAIVEVKSEVGDEQEMLGRLDVKARVVPTSVRQDCGWQPVVTGVVLVLPDTTAARDHVARHASTFAAALPARTRDVQAWLREPRMPLRGVWFLRDMPGENASRGRGAR